MKDTITLFHYTRAYPSRIAIQGLVARSPLAVRADFLRDHKLPTQILEKFNSVWNLESDDAPGKISPSIYFVASRPREGCAGIRPLIGMYGGEAIHMYVDGDEEVENFLMSLGTPLEVVCSIAKDDEELISFGGQEFCLTRSVRPDEIVELNTMSFFPRTNTWRY